MVLSVKYVLYFIPLFFIIILILELFGPCMYASLQEYAVGEEQGRYTDSQSARPQLTAGTSVLFR